MATKGVAGASNFGFLAVHDDQLVRLGMLAEKYFPDDPNTCLLKLRQLGELLAQLMASRTGLLISSVEGQFELLRRLQNEGLLPRETANLFHEIREAGNEASHTGRGDHRAAFSALRAAWHLGVWYHRTFKDQGYRSGPFIPPQAPRDESEFLREELSRLSKELERFKERHRGYAQELEAAEVQLRATQEDRAFWEQMASDAETARAYLQTKLIGLQASAVAKSAAARERTVEAAEHAAAQVDLNEADTRQIIDQQLRRWGWEVDTEKLVYAQGARPQRGKNRAIAEWPTQLGIADYILFVGLTPVAAVEAKRGNIDVSSSLKQSKRYARGFPRDPALVEYGVPWGEYRLPFAFSTNGRPYLQQLNTRSGIWFADLRRPQNLAHALEDWYTPDGLLALLKQDVGQAEARLATEPITYGFPLRPYQRAAIQAVEQGVAEGKRSLLLAMATGTGKTKTCVAIIYRFLKTQRFRRVLFLVDRSALGEQAADAFKDTRMDSVRTFAEIFGIKEIDEQAADRDTAVHIATVQGMVHRIQNASEREPPPAVDAYDCVVVDECHRGYLLDRDLSESELGFRSFDEYVSKYRRVIDYFDAVKIGLTATPALHTVQIFGLPVFTYSYREAVIDGFLIDHEPPIQIHTQLSRSGITWKKGDDVPIYDPSKNQIHLFRAPDEIRIDVDNFNRKVVTESFNKVVCRELAEYIDPSLPAKTLVFCVNDAHADQVVDLLKKAFAERYGEVDDDAVVKITGAADDPLELIRRYRNEINPNVAVTVDLLTTGIDVATISNLVFLRRVNSRILFDQMLGRATRLCEEINKDVFRIFDAVRLYEALGSMTAMQPVVVDPKITFSQLVRELTSVKGDKDRRNVLDQFVTKLQRKKRHLDEDSRREFETACGMAPDAFIIRLETLRLKEIAKWFTENPRLAEILDRKASTARAEVYVSSHDDAVMEVTRGYGAVRQPGDFLDEFTRFIRAERNKLPAVAAVLTRPRDLTRQQLKELQLELDQRGFTERNLETAWREKTNQEIAARIVGFIRQAALGDPLIPYEERVERALKTILVRQAWKPPQREWLRKIAEQTKVNQLVDRAAMDEPDLVFKREGGGFHRLDRVFEGRLGEVLDEFNDSIWPAA